MIQLIKGGKRVNNFCQYCGKELTESQDVCLNCGKKVNENPIQTPTENKNAVRGFVLGIISIIAWIIPLFGYPVTICGIVFSSKGINIKTNKGLAIAGLVLSIIFLIFTIINSIVGAVIGVTDSYY